MNFGGIQTFVLQGLGLILLVVAGFMFIKSKSGDVRGGANTVGVVILGSVVAVIGTGMLFPKIGASFVSAFFNV